MKITLVLFSLCALGSTMVMGQAPAPVGGPVVPTPPPPPTLAQDLDEIYRFIAFPPINQLIQRYLLNDAEFQAFVRIINSRDFHTLIMQFRAQPAVMRFIFWTRTQIMLSGGELQFEESEELLTIFNRTPFWANTVFGWQGFVNEFQAYYPQHMIRAHIDMKLLQNGIFTQFWLRLKALKPVYDQLLTTPQAQRIIAAMTANNIDFNQIDTFIRSQVDWVNPPTTTAAPTTAAPTTAAPTTAAPTTAAPTTAAPVASSSAPVESSPAPAPAAPAQPEQIPAPAAPVVVA